MYDWELQNVFLSSRQILFTFLGAHHTYAWFWFLGLQYLFWIQLFFAYYIFSNLCLDFSSALMKLQLIQNSIIDFLILLQKLYLTTNNIFLLKIFLNIWCMFYFMYIFLHNSNNLSGCHYISTNFFLNSLFLLSFQKTEVVSDPLKNSVNVYSSIMDHFKEF